jgi:hypothetical protein
MHSTCKTIPYGKNGTSPIKTIFRCICDSLAFSQTRFFVFIHPSPSLLKCKYIRKIKFLFLKYPNHPFITPKLFIFYILYISKKVLVRSRYRPGMDRVYLKSWFSTVYASKNCIIILPSCKNNLSKYYSLFALEEMKLQGRISRINWILETEVHSCWNQSGFTYHSGFAYKTDFTYKPDFCL